jgi:hypothetical protein
VLHRWTSAQGTGWFISSPVRGMKKGERVMRHQQRTVMSPRLPPDPTPPGSADDPPWCVVIGRPGVLTVAMYTVLVCVPDTWTDAEITAFTESREPSHQEPGWCIRHAGHPGLRGEPERLPCPCAPGWVRLVLDAG